MSVGPNMQALGQSSQNWDVPGAMRYLLLGLRGAAAIGTTCDFLNFHRGGYTGWSNAKGLPCAQDCGSYDETPLGCRAYKDGVVDGTIRVLNDTAYLTDERRVCEDIHKVRRARELASPSGGGTNRAS